jgi:Kyanoviridae DNA primase/helicase
LTLPQTIIAKLVSDETYARKVLPYLRGEYFDDQGARYVRAAFDIVSSYFNKYSAVPSREALAVELSQADNLTEDVFRSTCAFFESLDGVVLGESEREWLIDKTESFCKRRATYQAFLKTSVLLQEGKEDRLDAVLPLFMDASAISFDSDLGHDYLDDAEARFEAYDRDDARLKFDIEYLNKITRGGLPPKSLSVFMAPTGVGKSMVMSHLAAAHLAMGKNVVYFTLELDQTQISERIDANLMGVAAESIKGLSLAERMRRIDIIRKKTLGKLIVKEYPMTSAGALHFKAFLTELRQKRGFVPDIVYVDYVSVCCSSRIKPNSDFNSYAQVMYVAQELRAMAQELGIPVVTAAQTNRGGFKNSDVDMENVAESWGLPQTADFMVALIRTDEMDLKDQIVFKQLKNRWGDISKYRKIVVGVDRSKFRLYDAEESAQYEIEGGAQPPPINSKVVGAKLDFHGFK